MDNTVRVLYENVVKEYDFKQIQEQYENIVIQCEGENNRIELGQNLIFEDNSRLKIHFHGNGNRLIIDEHVCFHRNVNINYIPGGGYFRADNMLCRIGAGTIFNGGSISIHLGEENTNVLIGKNCLFAQNITMQTSDNHIIYDLESGETWDIGGDIRIGDHVWICQDVLILNNTEISNNTVVAARALVTKRFTTPNVVIGGAPAKVLRENCNWRH